MEPLVRRSLSALVNNGIRLKTLISTTCFPLICAEPPQPHFFFGRISSIEGNISHVSFVSSAPKPYCWFFFFLKVTESSGWFPSFGRKVRAHGASVKEGNVLRSKDEARQHGWKTFQETLKTLLRSASAQGNEREIFIRQDNFMLMSTGGLVNHNLQAVWK